jgi:hypothetical protein
MEKRRFPRIDKCAQQRILQLSSSNQLIKNFVLSQDISASGFKFRSPKNYKENELILVYLDDSLIDDLSINKARVMKAGHYFLGQVVWTKPLEDNVFFEVGCSFMELTKGDQDKIELFTRLMNEDIAEQIGTP